MVIRIFSAVVCVSTFDVCSGSVDIPIEFLLFGLVLSVATLDLWRSERGGDDGCRMLLFRRVRP